MSNRQAVTAQHRVGSAQSNSDTLLSPLEPHRCPCTWWTSAEACRTGLHQWPDARRSCVYRHTRDRGTPPNMRWHLEKGVERCGRGEYCLLTEACSWVFFSPYG